MSKPLLAVTMGDPAGIGAEIIVKAFSRGGLNERARPFVIGSADCLQLAMQQTGLSLPVTAVDDPEAVRDRPGEIQVLEGAPFDAKSLKQGEVSRACAASK